MNTYFHVLVKMSTDPQKLIFIFGDLSEQDLKKRFIQPYKKGAKILNNNTLIDLSHISSVQIIKTNKQKDLCLEELQSSSREHINAINTDSHITGIVLVSAGSGWNDEDISDLGEDVTAHYISAAPKSSSLFNEIINNQWTVAIVAGVILLLIAAFFGLN